MLETIWSDKAPGVGFRIHQIVPLPTGMRATKCPKCQRASVTGALISLDSGTLAIESSDVLDPNLLCTDCGFWWDE